MESSRSYLTGKFRLRPSRRKAAILRRVREATERVYWEVLESLEERVKGACNTDTNEKKAVLAQAKSTISQACKRVGLLETLQAGLEREIASTIASFWSKGGEQGTYPIRKKKASGSPDRYDAALDELCRATDRHEIDRLSCEVLRGNAPEYDGSGSPRGFILARKRDCRIIQDRDGRFAIALKLVSKDDPRSRSASLSEGIEAAEDTRVPAGISPTMVAIPIDCSRWQRDTFFSGRARLKSVIIREQAGTWIAQAQFEMLTEPVRITGASIGIDRGVVQAVVARAVSVTGRVLAERMLVDDGISRSIRRAEESRRERQRRTAKSNTGYRARIDHILHDIANRIVDCAKELGAEVTIEDLSAFKRVLTERREPGRRRNPWVRLLKRAQLGRLERILEYKLALAGLPPLRRVYAAGTSQTCSNCGHREPQNRKSQSSFSCVACGHQDNADANAAVQIARRGLLMRNWKKGDGNLTDRHAEMARALKGQHDRSRDVNCRSLQSEREEGEPARAAT